jgi:hypothetical protein
MHSDKFGPLVNFHLLGVTFLRNRPPWFDPTIAFCCTDRDPAQANRYGWYLGASLMVSF